MSIMLIRSLKERERSSKRQEGERRGELTDQKRRSCRGIFAFEVNPFVEDQNDQVEENTSEEQNLRQEFHKDRIMMSEVSESKFHLFNSSFLTHRR